MRELASQLENKRKERGAIEFNIPEVNAENNSDINVDDLILILYTSGNNAQINTDWWINDVIKSMV